MRTSVSEICNDFVVVYDFSYYESRLPSLLELGLADLKLKNFVSIIEGRSLRTSYGPLQPWVDLVLSL